MQQILWKPCFLLFLSEERLLVWLNGVQCPYLMSSGCKYASGVIDDLCVGTVCPPDT